MGNKPGPKRDKIERERDLVDVANLYLKGWWQQDIANHLSEKYYQGRAAVTQQQISYDIKALIKRWQKDQILKIDEAKGRELAKIDKLEREYWEAWEDSKQDAETVKQKGKPSEAQRGQVDTDSMERTVKGQVGDPRFLGGIQWCITQRCKILGIEAPNRNLDINMTQLSTEQLERLAQGDDVYSVLTNPGQG